MIMYLVFKIEKITPTLPPIALLMLLVMVMVVWWWCVCLNEDQMKNKQKCFVNSKSQIMWFKLCRILLFPHISGVCPQLVWIVYLNRGVGNIYFLLYSLKHTIFTPLSSMVLQLQPSCHHSPTERRRRTGEEPITCPLGKLPRNHSCHFFCHKLTRI